MTTLTLYAGSPNSASLNVRDSTGRVINFSGATRFVADHFGKNFSNNFTVDTNDSPGVITGDSSGNIIFNYQLLRIFEDEYLVRLRVFDANFPDGQIITDECCGPYLCLNICGSTASVLDTEFGFSTTWDPDRLGVGIILLNNNLTFSQELDGSGIQHAALSTLGVTSGKYYWEISVGEVTDVGVGTRVFCNIGIAREDVTLVQRIGASARGWSYTAFTGNILHQGISTIYGEAFTTGDVVMCALDMDENRVWFGKNGVWQSGDPSTGEMPAFSFDAEGQNVHAAVSSDNTQLEMTANFGATVFRFTPPAGFVPGLRG